MNTLIIFSTVLFICTQAAVHYRVELGYEKDLTAWYNELKAHDRMPPTYVRFLAFKKLIRDFNPIQDEMLKASVEAEQQKDLGIKERILGMSYDANREIEKRLSIHQPYIDAMRRRV